MTPLTLAVEKFGEIEKTRPLIRFPLAINTVTIRFLPSVISWKFAKWSLPALGLTVKVAQPAKKDNTLVDPLMIRRIL